MVQLREPPSGDDLPNEIEPIKLRFKKFFYIQDNFRRELDVLLKEINLYDDVTFEVHDSPEYLTWYAVAIMEDTKGLLRERRYCAEELRDYLNSDNKDTLLEALARHREDYLNLID